MSTDQAIIIERLEAELAQAEESAREANRQLNGEVIAPAIIRRAMEACETCRGLPEMSINRCGVCRVLQEALG
jgi:hypothetical protein